MSKKTVPAKPASTPAKESTAVVAAPRKDGIRETVESVVIAFVLAFLFRAFEAEAFVIPTGSMAPTLMGVHKDLTCPECGYDYRIGASEEQDDEAQRLAAEMKTNPAAANALAGREQKTAVCPNCRFEMDEVSRFPTYKGDRILVSKFPYDLANPDRWDVAVFKYPRCSSENYIKRVVGIPNETLTIHNGNVYTSHESPAKPVIERKPADKVRAIMQIVYDNDYVVPKLVEAGLPERWQAMQPGGEAWKTSDDFKSFHHEGAGGESWLGYQHLVATPDQWKNYADHGQVATSRRPVEPRLISDFYAYNAGRQRKNGSAYDPDYTGLHWVADLIMECDLKIESAGPGGYVTLRLIKGGRAYDCRIDPATGVASIWIDGADQQNQASTSLRAGSSHTISYANVDCQLLLWVDGDLVEFKEPVLYDPTEELIPTIEDLTPARIGAQGVSIDASHLRILRDVYYIAAAQNSTPLTDLNLDPNPRDENMDFANYLAQPKAWPSLFAHTRTISFKLGADEFLMLGDNSPRSKDGRLWDGYEDGPGNRKEYYVKRDLLVGKAVFVYWPHSWNKIPGTPIPFPFFPNFARMKLVR
jgi:signal peptidase I